MALNAGDEVLLNSILAEHGSGEERPRKLDAGALDDEDEAASLTHVHSFDVTPTMGATNEPRTRSAAAESGNDWDCDTDEEDTDCDDGPVRVVLGRQGDGGELRFKSFAAAAMSNRVPDNSTIYLADGRHDWPGGDLRHSIVGAGPDTIIEGNEGCGYFFYIRNHDVAIRDCTIRGVNRGRAHLYIDEITNINVDNVTFHAPYNMCAQILSSHQVRLTGCHFHDAAQTAVHIAKNSTHVSVRGNVFYDTCNIAHLVGVYTSMDLEVRDNVLRSSKTGVFNLVESSGTNVNASNNTVDWNHDD
eukprot:TRINITY_DN21180_c0_g1_i1.p2 TRINITY_DN21180_c0_g1~~TRINITY_DN21180_c0_g1_i1.p2  ORF type:complete len:302 (+),score=89.35 TRINITY_DN21180_c0_g1_i1:127-1032(+)